MASPCIDPEADVVATKRLVFALMREYHLSFEAALEVALVDVPLMLEHLAQNRRSEASPADAPGTGSLEDELIERWTSGWNRGVPKELTEAKEWRREL